MRILGIMSGNGITYKADIIHNNYLSKALSYAENELNGEYGSIVKKFHNSLKTIENDKNLQMLIMNANHIQVEQLFQDKKAVSVRAITKIGIAIMETINRFVEENYPQNNTAEEQKNKQTCR